MGSARAWWYLTYKESLAVCAIIFLGLSFFIFKIEDNLLDYNSDYVGFIETARLFAGHPEAEQNPARILKPLAPALIAQAPMALGFERAFLLEVGIFYVLLVLSAYLFFRLFFEGNRWRSIMATALFALSYPMLRYGLDLYTETGALFFYISGLMASLMFLRTPKTTLVWMNALIAASGFLWKEYSVVHFIIFNLIIVFHPLLRHTPKEKIRYLLLFNGLWVVISALWQFVVWTDYHYTYLDWYLGGGVPYFSRGGRFYMLAKSFFALLMIGWVALPFSYRALKALDRQRTMFFGLTLVAPLLVLAWGAISSRLFYVVTPALIIACVGGIEYLAPRRSMQAAAITLILASHAAWLLSQLP
jgi:hypothetical protein